MDNPELMQILGAHQHTLQMFLASTATKLFNFVGHKMSILISKDLGRFLGTHLFVKVPRLGDSEVIFSVFESSCHLLLIV